MKVRAVKTRRVTSRCCTLFELLDESLPEVADCSIVVITSKVVSLCEGRVVPIDGADREALVHQEAQYHLPTSVSKYNYRFTIINHTIMGSAGIDRSNGNGCYVLWPRDSQATANEVRRYLVEQSGHIVGVIIIDSMRRPFRLGTSAVAIGFSGFEPLRDYTGERDLFGRQFAIQQSDVLGGLAAAGGLVMGEGSEQTPLAVIEDVPFVRFRSSDPTETELATLRIKLEDDLYAPFFQNMNWQRGGKPG